MPSQSRRDAVALHLDEDPSMDERTGPAEPEPPESSADADRDEVGDRPADPTDVAEAAAPPTPPAPGRRPLVTVNAALAVTAAVLVVLGVVLGLGARADHADAQRREEIVAVARQVVVNVTTLSHETVDQDVANMLSDTTGDFRRQFEDGSSTFADVVREGQVESSGEVRLAGVEQVSEQEGTVLLAVHSTVRNSAAPDGEQRHYRLAVTMQHQEGRWLASNVEFVP